MNVQGTAGGVYTFPRGGLAAALEEGGGSAADNVTIPFPESAVALASGLCAGKATATDAPGRAACINVLSFLQLPRFNDLLASIREENDIAPYVDLLPRDMLLSAASRTNVLGSKNKEAIPDEVIKRALSRKRKRKEETWAGVAESIATKSCKSCGKATQASDEFYGGLLCMDCRKSKPEYKCMCRSRAMGEYILSVNDLITIPSIVVDNPHYKSAASMILYRVEDVKTLALKVHGSREAIESLRSAKKARRESRRSKRQDKLDKREKDLEDALAELGLVRRSDSRLCDDFMSGATKKTAAEVAAICARMRFLHDYSKEFREKVEDMEDKVERAVEEEGESNGYYRGINSQMLHELTGFSTWTEFKDEIAFDITMPEAWPWLVA
mmetsp:Transcript_1316/g.3025  ORF Transcript_1316/g.3025 Transcript_1316/m.3025 type:complete len:384 (-) Transcript_1316:112-1263(-)